MVFHKFLRIALVALTAAAVTMGAGAMAAAAPRPWAGPTLAPSTAGRADLAAFDKQINHRIDRVSVC